MGGSQRNLAQWTRRPAAIEGMKYLEVLGTAEGHDDNGMRWEGLVSCGHGM